MTDADTEMEPPEERKTEDEPPTFDWDKPSEVVSGDRTRDDFLDVALQLREPTSVSEIAERAGRGEDSAREYMRFFEGIGVVERVTDSPEQYRVNREYLRWRQVGRIRDRHSSGEIAEMLSGVTDRIDGYRDEFDAETPSEVSVVEHAEEHDEDVESVWRRLSDWRTDIERSRLLDEAIRRKDDGAEDVAVR
ncbi:MAG: hypothetical protein U5J64_02260 [Halobacteriales archaeon]|nr:hypothetical protein [Halobacteriales archaeon]